MDAWLSSKQSVAESDDYGQDLDDVEVKENKRHCMYCMAKQNTFAATFVWLLTMKHVTESKLKQTGYLHGKNLDGFLCAYAGLSEVASSDRKSGSFRKLAFSWGKVRSAHFIAGPDYKFDRA